MERKLSYRSTLVVSTISSETVLKMPVMLPTADGMQHFFDKI